MARTFRRDHDHVEIGARANLTEMDVETVGKRECRILLDVRLDLLAVQITLCFVRREDHDDVGRGDGFADRLDRQPGRFGLGPAAGPFAQTNRDADPGILQIVRMGMALRTVADDGDFLALNQREVRVFVVIDVHGHGCVSVGIKL